MKKQHTLQRFQTGRLLFGLLLCCLLTAGCRGSDTDINRGPKAVSEVAKEDQKDTKNADKEDTKEQNLEHDIQIPEDGVISQDQIQQISGADGEFRFHGQTDDGIIYTWIFDGSKIQNPVEQKLKVEFSSDGLDDIKKLAEDPPYALQVSFQKMELAAPATLEVTLNEKWDADRVLYCIYENGQLYQLDEPEIQDEEQDGGTVSKLRFQITKATDDVYVLLGGSTKGTEEDNTENTQNNTEDTKNTTENNSSGSDGSQTSESGNSTGTAEEDQSDNSQGQSGAEEGGQAGQTQENHICTISIECSSILNKWDDLKSTKAEFVPSDGWILYPSEVSFTPGDTAFDVLKNACNQAGIQMSSRYTPLYGSYYIEGINQLYEFDCGANSGWMFSVNGWFPNYGCSEYTVEDGDKIEWKYTCDLGSDVGNSYQE